MELIQHKSYGPVAALKRSLRKQIVVMLLMPFLLLGTSVDDLTRPLSSVVYWCYVAFCIGMAVFAINNYMIAQRMQRMDGLLKENLQQQITILEARMRWKVIGLRVVMLFFIVLIEILPYFQHFQMLDKWHSLSPMIRYSAYAGLLILQYFTNPMVLQHKFGRHLTSLKQLVSEL